MKNKIELTKIGNIDCQYLLESYQGWGAYAKWSNTFKLRRELSIQIEQIITWL